MRAAEVFKPQGTPTVTLVRDPLDEDAAQAFDDAIEEGGKLIRLVGPSKSGKTVFVDMRASTLQASLIRVSASGLADGADLWTRVLASGGAALQVETSEATEVELGASLTAKAKGTLFVATGEAGGTVDASRKQLRDRTESLAVDPLQTVIRAFAGTSIWVFIDDFHYVRPEVQRQLAEQIKHACEERVQIILALIPGRSEDILQANSDLQGRIRDVRFAYWRREELAQIAEAGFPLLGILLEPGDALRLADEAAGTPQLMQAICLEFARYAGTRAGPLEPARPVELNVEVVEISCRRAARGAIDLSKTIDQMRLGPPTRGNPRKAYPASGGSERDVYQLLIQAFGMDPPLLKFSASELQRRVDQLAGSTVASVWESVRHMAAIANNMNTDMKIDFAGDERLVTILDPYLYVALRWGIED